MEALHLQGLTHVSTFSPFLHCHSHSTLNKTKISYRVAAKLSDNDDPLFGAALHSASLHPLFHDPYVACLVTTNTPVHRKHHTHPYCLATRFVDDTLLQTLQNTDELKQVVLLTDGADTRAYRLTWPSSTLIFDISPDRIYSEVSQKLKDIGAQISKSCLMLHVSQESSNMQELLQMKGFNGQRPSIWILQGLPLMTLTTFEDLLTVVNSLAMKGNVARSLGRDLSTEMCSSILFTAEHLRFSDDQ
ncbi:putative S-adenosyl-L-methionine-dependent methyltransferase, partial [Bienertia sinuspersici]